MTDHSERGSMDAQTARRVDEDRMADDERRAELEAVARALAGDDQGPWYAFEEDAEKAIAALDRVRDARGDDEGCPDCHKTPETCWLPPKLCKHPARSPQSEDDEGLCPECQ